MSTTDDGRELMWVALEPIEQGWHRVAEGWMEQTIPAGTHLHKSPRAPFDGWEPARPMIQVTATDWLRWTRIEFTDEARFHDHSTGAEWIVRRSFPDDAETPEPSGDPVYVGRGV